MKKLETFQFVIMLLGISLLGACGKAPAPSTDSGPSPTSSYTSTKDACTLFTKDEVSQVLGQSVEVVEAKGLGGVCSYQTKNLHFELTVSNSGGVDYMKEIREKIGDKALSVPELGDDAFYNPFASTLIARKGDAMYLFNLNDTSHNLTDEDKQAIQKTLAKQLFSHLH
jgi:hypothetical protein